ncbi:MAG: hypothetical protein Q8L22_02310 [Reyranella sp.]|nr:hypothetical protein [Reyranella sp.]
MASIKIERLAEAAPVEEPWPVDDHPIGIQADEMFARQLDTGIASEIRALVHDPGTGLASKGPEDALGGVAEAIPMLGELKDRYLAQAIGLRQRTILEPLIDSHLDRATGDLGRIAQQATSALDDRIVAERIADLQQDASLAWHDPAHLRLLGRSAANELRYQGERRGWDEAQTDATVRQGLSDLYAGAVEEAIGRDPGRAAKLYEHARDVIQPERQAVVERKIERAREARRVTEIVGVLAETPDDATRRPDFDDYRARASELTPSDVSPEVRAQVNRMIRIEHAQADRAWQAARGRAAVAAVDWLDKNPAARLLAMLPELRDRLSPEQTEALAAAAINGGRVATDRDLHEALDGQAVHEPEVFAAIDLAQHRLSLGDHDYQRLVGFQKAVVEGRSDAAFERHSLGRTLLDEGLRKANVDPARPEARAARQQLDRLLSAFEAVEGGPPTMADIRSLVGDVLSPLADDPNIVRVAGGDPAGADGNAQVAQQQEPAEARRGIAPNVEPIPGSAEFRAAHLDAVGDVVHLPDGTTIPDENSPTGYVMAPDTDLAKVAAAGRIAGERFASALSDPNLAPGANLVLAGSLGALVGQGGIYDYQRRGNRITGFTQLPHFRNISNVNVGLAGQQAGLSLDKLLEISGQFAQIFSSNFDPKAPYGLPAQNRRYIEIGYEIGRGGAFGPPASLTGKR